MNRIKEIIQKAIQYLQTGVWQEKLESLSKRRRFFVRLMRITILTITGFEKNNLSLNASALTFYTALSIVPVLAMAFGLSQGFGLEKILENLLRKVFDGQQEVLDWSLTFATSLLHTTSGGMIAGISMVFLIWSVIQLLNSVEDAFNLIWRVTASRSYAKKLTDYVTIIVISPILIIVSSSLTIFITSVLQSATQSIIFLSYFSPVITSVLKFIPYTLVWLLLTLLYFIMPNTRVKFSSALVAGIIAGTVFQLTQWGYINFQVGVSRSSAIYGSFAALPLFLIWLQISWLIVLTGAEITYNSHNIHRFEYLRVNNRLSPQSLSLLHLIITTIIVKRFAKAEAPISSMGLSQQIEAPVFLIEEVLADLIRCSIISQVSTNLKGGIAYQPAQDINLITIASVLKTLDENGEKLNITTTEESKTLRAFYHEYSRLLEQSKYNKLLKDI